MVIKHTQTHNLWYIEREIFDYRIIQYISHAGLIVYLTLHHHANINDPQPLSLPRLTYECYLDKKTIVKAIRLLKQYHLLEVIHQKNQENIYIIHSVYDAIKNNHWQKLTNIEQMPQSIIPTFSEPLPPKVKFQMMTNDCPYYNERGLIKFVDEQNGRFEYLPCNHDLDRIKMLALNRKNKVVIASALEGYKYPCIFNTH